MKLFKSLIITLSLLSLAGCGFHLRGAVNLPKNLSSLYVQSNQPNAPFIQELLRLLHANKIKTTNQKTKTNATLNIMNIQQSSQLASLTGSAEAGLYSITESIQFEIINKDGQVLLPETSVQAKRFYNSNATQILSANAKTNQLAKSMRTQLAQAVLDQLTKVPPLKSTS